MFHVIYHVFVKLAVFEKLIHLSNLFTYLFTHECGLFNSTTRYLYYIVLNIRVIGE